jgi:hypothetical protein
MSVWLLPHEPRPLFLIARTTGGDHIAAGAPAPSSNRNDMVHGEGCGRKHLFTVVAAPACATLLPPGTSAQFPRSLSFPANMLLIHADP